MHLPTQERTTINLSVAERVYCPRCDGSAVRLLPRITVAHAGWCECRTCGYLWVTHPHGDAEHVQLYGRR